MLYFSVILTDNQRVYPKIRFRGLLFRGGWVAWDKKSFKFFQKS